MPRARSVCTQPGCPELTAGGTCPKHRKPNRSGTNGYGGQHKSRFRPAVLARDPICVMPGCGEPSTDADHWPLTRKELVAAGLDPDAPEHGRGLCRPCHSRHTRLSSHKVTKRRVVGTEVDQGPTTHCNLSAE